MENTLICPTCKTVYEIQPERCPKCGFPFSGTEKEKSIFIGQQILKKGKVTDTRDRIKRARIILWVIGGINILFPMIFPDNYPTDLVIIFNIIIGFVFIGFGFLTYNKPLISILIPLIILVLFYISNAIIDPSTIVKGLLWKVLILTGLIYGLVSIIEADKIKKESRFLKEHDYK